MNLRGVIQTNKLRTLARGNSLRTRLVRGALGSAGIQAANRLLSLALGIVLARTLGASGYGVYAYAFAIMSLLMVAAQAGVPILLMREVAASHAREEWGILRGVIRRGGQFVGLVSVCVSAIGFLVLWWQADALSIATFYTTGIMLLVLPCSALSKTIAHALFGLQRVVTGKAISMLIQPTLVLVLVTAVFLIRPDLQKPQYAMVAQWIGAAAALITGLFVLNRYRPALSKAAPPVYHNRAWLNSALPFTLIGAATILNNQVDIIMLGWFETAQEVGIYRVAVQGAALVVLVLTAANAIIAPHFARLYAKEDYERLQRIVTQSARYTLLAALPGGLVLIVAGGAIARWIFGVEFAAVQLPLAILVVGQLVNIAFGSVGFLLNMTGHERLAARALWQTAGLNIVMNAILIPFFGMAGAAFATALSTGMWNILLFKHVRHHLPLLLTAFRI